MSGIYQQLCNLFIKPSRQAYSDHDLGPLTLGPHGVRQNFTLTSHQSHEIKASFFRNRSKNTDTCVLYLHSFNGSRLESLRYAGEVLSKGFHFCSFDFAGCGNSGGEYVSLGCNERWDVLKITEQVKLRYGITKFFVWGRSMGAVAAIKFYQLLVQQQKGGRLQDIIILGLVLDSAFISLKRMVVQVAQSKISIPAILVKAVFMMVSSSIQEKAGFKVEQLELTNDVQTIRCSTLLLASKEDSFVNYTHSEEIFSKLKLHDNKQIQYTRGQHYESRDSKTLSNIYSFFQKKHKKYNEQLQKTACLNHSRINCHQNLQQFSIQKHTKSLRKYQPKISEKRTDQLKLLIQQSNKKINHNNTINQSSTKIVLFRSIAQQKQIKSLPSAQYKITTSDKKIQFKQTNPTQRNYQTQKKIQDPHSKIIIANNLEKQKNSLRNKSKPHFVCKIEDIYNTHTIEDTIEKQLSRSTERTQEQIDSQENHCNVIADKLKKKSKNQRQRILQLKQRNDFQEIPSNQNEIVNTPQLKNPNDQLTQQQSIKRPKINFTIGNQPSTPVSIPQQHQNSNRSCKKLSMTAQQYKNSQIKGIIALSPNIRKRGQKGSCTDLKTKTTEDLKNQHTKSMNTFHPTTNDPLSFRNISSILNISNKK